MNEKKKTAVKIGPWEWTIHPTQWMPTEQEVVRMVKEHGINAVHALWKKREELIELEKTDPLFYGWENPVCKVIRDITGKGYKIGSLGEPTADAVEEYVRADDLLIMGGNRVGKTDFVAKYVVEILWDGNDRVARVFSQNQKTSIAEQQKMLFKYLPSSLRMVKRQGMFTKISYTQHRGFSLNTFVLPNRSQCWMFTYEGWRQDKTMAEGGEADIIWCDEEVPSELLDTLRYRTGGRAMKLIVSFTPISGYSQSCAQYIEGADIVETLPARKVKWNFRDGSLEWGDWLLDPDKVYVPGCKPGHIPFLLVHRQVKNRAAVLMPTVFNPYIDVEQVLSRAENKPIEVKLARWFGWPTKRAAKAFPTFSRWHIVKPERVPDIRHMNIHQFVDPHGQRNWFMIWIAVDRDGKCYVIDEWPDVDEYGEWAVPGDKADGKPGPAQTYGGGKSFMDYKQLILIREGWHRTDDGGVTEPEDGSCLRIYQRWMDPRPAGTSVPSDEIGLTYVDHMARPVVREDGTIKIPGIEFYAAPSCKIEEGIQLINDWLMEGWNPNKEITPMNCPSLYISEKCQNLIYALKNYTGEDGEKGACKDPIDCLKAAAKIGLYYEGQTIDLEATEGFAY